MGLQRLQDVERCLLVTPVTPAIFEGLQLRPAPVLARTHVTPVTLENNEVRQEFKLADMTPGEHQPKVIKRYKPQLGVFHDPT